MRPTAVPDAASVPAALGRARDLVRPALQSCLERLSPEIRSVAAYQLGFADPEGRPGGGAGKGIRPALALLSAEAAGAPAATGLPGAAAVELVHDFSLLHDDVMDHDRERRHRPTAWALFGVGPAILAGDALLTLVHQELLGDGGPSRVRACASLARATAEMIAGQGEDLAFESRDDVTVPECLRMSARKTGALMSCAASIGGILAEAHDAVVGALAGYGRHLGLAFQAVDDLLGTWGDPAVTGKPSAGDLRQRKMTLPLVAALAAEGPGRDELAALASSAELTEDDLRRAVLLIEELGGRDRAVVQADHQLELALGSLGSVDLDAGPRAELEELARFVTRREF